MKDFTTEYREWAETFTDAPPQFHHYAALWAVSTIVGRNVYIRLGDYTVSPNLWMVLVAPSSFYRKSTAIGISARMVREVNPRLIMPNEWTQEAFLAMLQKQPHAALVAYEFKSLLSMMARTYNIGAMPLLTELYDCPDLFLRRKGVEKEIEFRIEKPCLSILGASTMEWLTSCIESGDISGGFLSRFVFVSADSKPKDMPFPPPADMEKRQALVASLAGMCAAQGEAHYTEAAKAHYTAWYERFCKQADRVSEHLRAFYPRLTIYAHKFAMLGSVMAGRFPDISLEDSQEGCLIAENLAQEVAAMGQEGLGSGGADYWSKARTKVLRCISRNPGIDYRRLMQNTGLSARVMREVIEALEDSGAVLVTTVGKGRVFNTVIGNGAH